MICFERRRFGACNLAGGASKCSLASVPCAVGLLLRLHPLHVPSSAVCNAAALVSRQYMDMSRIRIEGLLAAFPKLVGSGKQHTYVETENVRYVYQPIEVSGCCSCLQRFGNGAASQHYLQRCSSNGGWCACGSGCCHKLFTSSMLPFAATSPISQALSSQLVSCVNSS